MAYNPSPLVKVARDAASMIGVIRGEGQVEQCIVFYVYANGRIGYSSYGRNKLACDSARRMADRMFDTATKTNP